MPNPVAQLVTGKTSFGAMPEKLIETADGLRGTRWYVCDTHDIEAALEAEGLPRLDEAWSGDREDLVVISREPEYVGGTDSDATGIGGTSYVKVEYETPGTGGRLPPPTPGQQWTECVGAESTFTRYYDVRVETIGGIYQIPLVNGRGVSIGYGTTALNIVQYLRPTGPKPPLKLMMKLQRLHALNLNRIVTPRTRVGSVQWILDPGQAMYKNYSVDIDSGMVRVTHQIEIAEDFDVRWYEEDDRGNAIPGSERRSQVYKQLSFSGLWVGA